MTTPATTTAAAPAVPAKKKTLRTLIEDMTPEIARALPRHITPDRMARIATTALKQTPKLGECTPESFLGSVMTAAQLGLEPNTPLGEAYLVPFKNKNRETGRYEMVCQFIPGYRGLVKLALQSPAVSKARARVVYEHDAFDYSFGLDEHLDHKPAQGDRGKVTHVYAFVKYTDGGSDFDVMNVDDVEKVRRRSKSADNGPWVTDWDAMAMKTVFKRLSKWIPMSTELAAAASLDESVRTELAADLADVRAEYVDGEVVAEAPAITEAAEPEPSEPAADVQLAGRTELAQLKAIRAQEKYDDDAAWADFVHATINRRVDTDTHLTLDEARKIIDLFNEDAQK